ncbi:unnamed protein product [Didymodactylos carnosus]|uniref:Uncharacterized protein n=1 Tax=Didymodactylos carnosus TaxID=1234261 RepID=A0A815CYQ0_9BILA|nr:unnamed protein product [Didymodactylos carnosus]CAF4095965.1 unnamed protein product [Didymodactylos carnosus]
MAVVIGRNEVGIKRTTRPTTIANNDVAKLMYYLNCVCETINCDQDEDIRRFTNYANWARLSAEQRKLLLVLCYTFSPDVFDGKVFFNIEELCVEFSNEFYEISQLRHRLVAVESIIIAGRAHQVTKIMTYTMSWMRAYYLEPMQRLARQFAAESSRPSLSAPHRQRQSTRPVPAPSVDSSCCCTIL